MAPERVAAYLGGGILLAAWLASATGVTRQPRSGQRPQSAPEAVQLNTLASEVQSQAARLRQRLAAAPAPQTPLRNPFVFASRDVAARTAPRRVEPPPPLIEREPVAAEPALDLVGIAEQGSGNDLVRTAMIEAPGELFIVTIGQPVVGRYLVSAIGADAVELKEIATGATRRLFLKSPASPR